MQNPSDEPPSTAATQRQALVVSMYVDVGPTHGLTKDHARRPCHDSLVGSQKDQFILINQ